MLRTGGFPPPPRNKSINRQFHNHLTAPQVLLSPCFVVMRKRQARRNKWKKKNKICLPFPLHLSPSLCLYLDQLSHPPAASRFYCLTDTHGYHFPICSALTLAYINTYKQINAPLSPSFERLQSQISSHHPLLHLLTLLLSYISCSGR